ncbi:hypothetical protein BWI15_35570 [Kribbella sp. ALI-6-A]|uniref:hypothetical protein n=1 Tax=Kribbella sp. ALI-6-A TaxID=1933817 RepID=UPI00097C90FB|nr:hypothetical protein [Kribbella sp. ALI-6-A]ONI68329.1 hypothetical protein BWI15_35570 [Kribbella sp. ALI-6-A]
MSLFSEEEQAAPRRALLRSTWVRRTAACIALPIGLYAVLAGVGLLPAPWSGATDAVAPVAGPPSTEASDLPYPSIQGDPRPETTPTAGYSTEPPGVGRREVQPDGRSGDGFGDGSGRPTPVAPTTGPAQDRTRRVLPTITARPPVLPTETPSATAPPSPPSSRPTTTPTSSPQPSGTPSPTPPVTDPDDPTLVDRLFGWLDALVP